MLCERASVVIFTKDSFTFKDKPDHQGGVHKVTTEAQLETFFGDGTTAQFPQASTPTAYYCVRRYKNAAENAAALGIPKELYGQTIAVELARGGHMSVFGAGAALPANAAHRHGHAQGHNANVCRQVFTSRFEAREGRFPPSMTYAGIAAGSAVVGMSAANISELDLANRWDTFECKRFVTIGYQGGAAAYQTQIAQSVNLDTSAYTAAVDVTDRIATTFHTDRYPTSQAAAAPAAAVGGCNLSPDFSLGRYRYILTPSGPTSACSRNNLGSLGSVDYMNNITASNCYATLPKRSYEERIPSGFVPIKQVQMKWRDQGPCLLCEWAVLKKIEPVYSLYYPQFEKYVDDTFTSSNTTDVRTGEVYRYGTFSLPEPFKSEIRSITGIRERSTIPKSESSSPNRTETVSTGWMSVPTYQRLSSN